MNGDNHVVDGHNQEHMLVGSPDTTCMPLSNSPPGVYESTSTGNGETQSVGGRQMSNPSEEECLQQWHQQSSHDFFNALLPPPESLSLVRDELPNPVVTWMIRQRQVDDASGNMQLPSSEESANYEHRLKLPKIN